MLVSFRVLAAAWGIACLAGLVAVSGARASPVSNARLLGAAAAGSVVKVHSDWRDDEEREYRRYRHNYDRQNERDDDDDDDDGVVVAPFTRVEHGHRVVVDAPFAHVYVGHHGRHVVAPFVNIWIPR